MMIQMFGGMIIGSMMTMVLLGGPSAAEQVLNNAPVMMEQYAHSTPLGNGIFLLSLGLSLALWATWRTQQACQTARIIKKIRRCCS